MKLEHTSHVHLARFIVLILCTILSELSYYIYQYEELTALCSLIKVHHLICTFFLQKIKFISVQYK